MSAYGIEYLDDAMRNLGEMTDYAVNACGMDLEDFWKLFLTTGYAEKFGEGVPRVVSGFSGTELAEEVLRKAGKKDELPEPQVEFTCSREYWSGWILAYYQWYSEKKFKEIEAGLPVREVVEMYPALHEAPEDKFVENHSKKRAGEKRVAADPEDGGIYPKGSFRAIGGYAAEYSAV